MESSPEIESPYQLLFRAAICIPVSHYLMGLMLILAVFLYNFLEMHFIEDLFTGFRGQPVALTFNASSHVYREVVSKCQSLHGRYLSTPWLCSPHLQTIFLHFFGNPPVVNYRRQIFVTPDGGTLAWDWVIDPHAKEPARQIDVDEKTPIIIVVPGLTSDSDSAYVKHLAFKMAKHGNVVVGNHRGLGGVALTSDCFYTGGWTEDIRTMIGHLHHQYPEAPLFVVGTSVGANVLVKYLGEEGSNTPIVGAAAICSPWDLLIGDKFLSRQLLQRLYNKVLTSSLKEYSYMHEAVFSRITNWECVKESRWFRDYMDSATRHIGKFETVDTYYRKSSSSIYVGRVTVPLLCISSLDDPVCTSEAIAFDECRLNNNVVLATTQHGGHLPFFEGLTAKSSWWVRAVDEFFVALMSSPLSYRQKQEWQVHLPVPSVNTDESKSEDSISIDGNDQLIQNTENDQSQFPDSVKSPEQEIKHVVSPVKSLNQLARQNVKSLWLLAYIAIITTWPVLGSALTLFLRKKFQNFFSAKSLRK